MAETGIQMSGDRKPIPVRLIDQCRELRRLNAFGLEPLHAAHRPFVHFLADAFRRFGRSLPTRACRAEVRTRSVQAGANLLASFEPTSRRFHPHRINFAGRERGGHTIGEKQHGVDRVFVDAALPEQVNRIVGVQIEEARQNRFRVGETHDPRGGQIAARQIRPDLEKNSLPHHDPRVRHQRVADAVEQPAAHDDDVAGLDGGGGSARATRLIRPPTQAPATERGTTRLKLIDRAEYRKNLSTAGVD
jgi:hypothetical protein